MPVITTIERKTGHRIINFKIHPTPFSVDYTGECKHCNKHIYIDSRTNSVYVDRTRIGIFRADIELNISSENLCYKLRSMF